MEKNSLRIVKEKVTGSLIVWSNSQYNIVEADHIVVLEDVFVRLFGKAKKITLRENSTAFIHGSADDVVNEGGTIKFFKK